MEVKTIEFIVKAGDRELNAVLRPMGFSDYKNAAMCLDAEPGYLDKLGAGSSVVQHCWVSGDETLKNGDESKDPVIAMAYASLCMKVYNELIQIFEVEVKKN